MTSISFAGCDLTGTNLKGADLSDCRFNETVLKARFTTINAANSRLYLLYAGIKNISLLKGFKGLNYLGLGSNEVADISPLQTLTQLTELYISGNLIPDDQIAALKEALPGLTVHK
jgi:Leucine-rich repeat (LRR) protein